MTTIPADATATTAAAIAAADAPAAATEIKKMAARLGRQWQRATDDALAEIEALQANLARMAEAITRGESAGPLRGTDALAAAIAARDTLAATCEEVAYLRDELAYLAAKCA